VTIYSAVVDASLFEYLLSFYLLYPLVLSALTEAFYRKNKAHRWAIRPICLGLGALFIFDFYIYSEALLLGAVSGNNLVARAGFHFAVAPLLLLGTKRNPTWDLNIFISRDVVLQSTLVFGAGIYLTLMAGVGYYIKAIGASWSSAAQALFISLAFVLLVALFLSEGIRKRLRVYIAKHFFANKHDYRQEWLALTDNLIQADNQAYASGGLKAILSALKYPAGALVRTSATQLSIMAEENCTVSDEDIQRLSGIQPFLSDAQWVLDLDEYQRYPARYAKLDMTLDDRLLQSDFRIIIPLFLQQRLYAILLLRPEQPRGHLVDWEERDYIDAVGNQVVQYLAANEAGQQLAQNAQFAAFNQMSAFVVHDLKNVQAQISMLIKNAKKHRHNPEFVDDAFETMEHMQERLARMLEQLKGKKMSEGAETRSSATLAIKPLLEKVLLLRSNKLPAPQLRNIDDIVVAADKERLQNILCHLIENAQDATDDSGSIEIDMHVSSDFAKLSIRDNGCGMSETFIRDGLFTPFVTTKGNAGMGIGVYEARKYIQEVGGQLTVESQPQQGTTFSLTLPRCEEHRG
jgi:putative PEP-CTERM system histidine kinase